MTRNEALKLLELTGSATPEEIRRAYEALYTDFGIRVDNAPTDKLRERFRERMRRLEQAYALLQADAAEPARAADRDLPGLEPTRGDGPQGGASDGAGAGTETGAPPDGSGRADERDAGDAPRPEPEPEPAVLLLRVAERCTVVVDGGTPVDIPAGKALRVRLSPGTHTVEAVTADGRRWREEPVVAAGLESVVEATFPQPAPQPEPKPPREPEQPRDEEAPDPVPAASGAPSMAGMARAIGIFLGLSVLVGVGLTYRSATEAASDPGAAAEALPLVDTVAPAVLRVTADAEGVVHVDGRDHPVAPGAPARVELPAGAYDVVVRSAADSTVLVRHGGVALEWGSAVALDAALGDSLEAHEARRAAAAERARPRIKPGALHEAVEAGRTDELRRLLAAGADVNSPWGYGGSTALHVAASYADVDATRLLLEHGADVRIRGDGGVPMLGRAALHIAASRGEEMWDAPDQPAPRERYRAVMRLLLARGADPNQRAWGGRTPLHFAAQDSGATETLRLLIDAGARVEDRTDFGDTPLYFAAFYAADADMVRELLDRGADVNAANDRGDTPLHVGMRADVLRLLLQRGADMTRTNKKGQTPLAAKRDYNSCGSNACRSRYAELIRVLEQAGAR